MPARPPAQGSLVKRRATDLAAILAGSLVVALSARLSVSLPFSPVPITGQSLAVLVVGLLLGPVRGGLALVAYVLEGLLGWPVFADGESGEVLSGPTAGYILAFIPAATFAGWAGTRGHYADWPRSLLSLSFATALIFAGGLPWLAAHGIPNVFANGCWPYLPGAAVKTLLAAAVARTAHERVLAERHSLPAASPVESSELSSPTSSQEPK